MKKNIKLITTILMVTMVVTLLGGCGNKEVKEAVKDDVKVETKEEVKEENKVLNKIKDSGKLVVGTSADYPPYEFHKMDGGKDTIVGFDMEIAKEIASDLGVELKIVDIEFNGLLAALGAGKVDMIVAGMSPNKERKESVDFSDIYYKAEHSVVMRKDEAGSIKTTDDLAGKVIGVQLGSIQEGVAETNITNAKEIKKVSKIPDLVLMLKNNKIDAIVMEVPVAEAYTNDIEDIDMTELTLQDEEGGSAVATKKNNQEFVNKINESLKKLIDEDKINEFYAEAVKIAAE